MYMCEIYHVFTLFFIILFFASLSLVLPFLSLSLSWPCYYGKDFVWDVQRCSSIISFGWYVMCNFEFALCSSGSISFSFSHYLFLFLSFSLTLSLSLFLFRVSSSLNGRGTLLYFIVIYYSSLIISCIQITAYAAIHHR